MKMIYFEDDDIIHLRISAGAEHSSVSLSPHITAELGKNGDLIGIEILDASKYLRDAIMDSAQARLLSPPKRTSA